MALLLSRLRGVPQTLENTIGQRALDTYTYIQRANTIAMNFLALRSGQAALYRGAFCSG
jgi:hypothetical protein